MGYSIVTRFGYVSLRRALAELVCWANSNRMLRYLSILMVAATWGCVSQKPALSLAHDIDVPSEFRAGNFSAEHPGFSEGNSTIERYVDAYERGWSIAVDRYANDINFSDPSALPMSGWFEEAAGGADGYGAGRDHIEDLIRTHGKQKVSAYLQQFRVPGGK
jgi:hypothetical protein